MQTRSYLVHSGQVNSFLGLCFPASPLRISPAQALPSGEGLILDPVTTW
jgi:hypothetical protein